MRIHIFFYPPDPVHYAKVIKCQFRGFAFCELVPHWYKSFLPEHFGQAEKGQAEMSD